MAYVDRGLATHNDQVREMYPGIVIYSFADDDHAKRKSDHNAEEDGSVDASDYMIRGSFTKADAEWLFQRHIEIKDPRFKYAIYNRRIVSSEVHPWVIRDYSGDNPHTDHVHLSVNDKHENDTTEWELSQEIRPAISLGGFGLPDLKYGTKDSDFGGWNMVQRVQKMLGIKADGIYGPATAKAVAEYMGGGNGRVVNLTVWRKLYGLSQV